MKTVILLIIIITLGFLLFMIKDGEFYKQSASTPAYATLTDYGGAYNDFYMGDTEPARRCAAGPYTYSSKAELDALYSTVPQDVLDKVDCRRVERVHYTSPAFGGCGSYNSQISPGYRVTGAPQLKYPVIEDLVL